MRTITVYEIHDDEGDAIHDTTYFATLAEAKEALRNGMIHEVGKEDSEIHAVEVGPFSRKGVVAMLNREGFAISSRLVGVMRPVWCGKCDACDAGDERCENIRFRWIPADQL